MNHKAYLVIEFKLGNLVPWTFIYKTTDINMLMNVYRHLISEKLPDHFYRCSILTDGRYCPIIF